MTKATEANGRRIRYESARSALTRRDAPTFHPQATGVAGRRSRAGRDRLSPPGAATGAAERLPAHQRAADRQLELPDLATRRPEPAQHDGVCPRRRGRIDARELLSLLRRPGHGTQP